MAAFEIRLRSHASFQEKLLQFVGKQATKKGTSSVPLSDFRECRSRGKF
jgi:hypothetical protein